MRPLPQPPLTILLRESIRDAHQRIEQTAIARAMVGRRVLRPAYIALLASLSPIHRALDLRIRDEGCAPMQRDLAERADAVDSDLAALGGERPPANDASRALCGWLSSIRHPITVGAAYVVAGSRMGSAVLRPLLATALAVDADRHLRTHEPMPRERWQAQCAELDAWPADAVVRGQVVEGARGMMDGLLAVYAGIPHA